MAPESVAQAVEGLEDFFATVEGFMAVEDDRSLEELSLQLGSVSHHVHEQFRQEALAGILSEACQDCRSGQGVCP